MVSLTNSMHLDVVVEEILDTDGDGIGNNADDDDDGDNVLTSQEIGEDLSGLILILTASAIMLIQTMTVMESLMTLMLSR